MQTSICHEGPDTTFNHIIKESSIHIELVVGYDSQVLLRNERKISATTIGLYVAAVIHFYAMNDVIVNRKKIGMYIGEYIKKQKDKAYTNEQIQRLLDFSDERSKALILLLTSTGMRIGAIADQVYLLSFLDKKRSGSLCYILCVRVVAVHLANAALY